MENYVWLASAAAISLTVFLLCVWRGYPQEDAPRVGVEGHIGVLAETANGIGGDQPASSYGRG